MQCECAVLSYVACRDLPYFSALSHKRHDFRKTQNVCFVFLSNFCLKHFSVYEELNEILLKMYIYKVPVILVTF